MSVARRYLLGDTSEDEAAAVEQGYFRDADALDGIANEEEALIDAYLAGELDTGERARFEQHYLASPVHRRRVDATRMLRQVRSPRSAAASMRRWLAVAAVLCMAIGSAWLLSGRRSPAPRRDAIEPTVTQATPEPVAPALRVLAFSLPLINVRGADGAPPLIVPAGIDVVRLDLQGGRVAGPELDVVLQTVAGTDVWRGRAATESLPPGVAARVDVPAGVLRPDDYFVIAGDAQRYFLSVRPDPSLNR